MDDPDSPDIRSFKPVYCLHAEFRGHPVYLYHILRLSLREKMRTNKRIHISPLLFISVVLLAALLLSLSLKSPGYNVILITADSLRPDHLGCYGYKRQTTPCLDKFAEDSALFTQAIAHSSHTPVSAGSILAGDYLSKHGIEAWGYTFDPAVPNIAEILKKNGYKTIFISHPHFKQLAGFQRGFGLFLIEDVPEDKIIPSAIRQLEKLKNKKFFMWIHYMGTHAPYFAPEDYLGMFLNDRFYNPRNKLPVVQEGPTHYGFKGIPEWLVVNGIKNPDFYIAAYDASIRFFDWQLNSLFEKLKELGLYKKTLIIITSDHGELLGEHGYYFHHGFFLYEPLIKVPLVIHADNFLKGKIIKQQVEASVDIVPTIIDMLKIKTKVRFDGSSLIPLMLGKENSHKEFAFLDRGTIQTAIRMPPWKLIRYNHYPTVTYELYNIDKDPQESVDLIKARPEIFQSLKKKLDDYSKSALKNRRARKPMDEKSKEKLRSLGYVQ